MNALAPAIVIHRAVLRHAFVPAPFRINPIARSIALFGNLNAIRPAFHIIFFIARALVATFIRLRLATTAVASFVAGDALAAAFVKLLVVPAYAETPAFSRPLWTALAATGHARVDALAVAFEKVRIVFR